MEDNIEIEISETNRGNEQIIINKKHKFNFSFQRKDKSKIYRCTEYKTLNKCKSWVWGISPGCISPNLKIIK